MKISELQDKLRGLPNNTELGICKYHDEWGIQYSLCYKKEDKIVNLTGLPIIKETYVGY